MKHPTRLNNVIFDRDEVVYVRYDEKDSRTVVIHFKNGDKLYCEGDEAVQCWKLFDDEKSYQDE